MRWKDNVQIIKEQCMWVVMDNEKKQVEEDDRQIISLMEDGISDDCELVKRVMADLGWDEIYADIKMAEFVEKYGHFLAEGQRNKIFSI